MPNRYAHTRITIISGALISPLVLWLPVETLAIEAGVILTLWVNPDTDLKQRLGPFGAAIGFDDYAKEAPHRGGMTKTLWRMKGLGRFLLMSHLPIVGTLTRVVLLASPWVIVCAMFSLSLVGYAHLVGLMALGMCWSDLWHIVADKVWSDTKEWASGRHTTFRRTGR